MSMSDKRQTSARLRVVRSASDAAPSEPVLSPAPGPVQDPLDALYRRYSPYVASIATRLLGRDGEVDDLVQDVFIEAMRGIAGVRERNAIKGWLAKITVRMSVKRLRKRRWLNALHLDLDHDDYERLAGRSATAEQRALVAKIYRVLDQLPARTRVIWSLRHVLEEPLHAIVELTACSQSTVQRKLRDAEAVLAKELQDE
jgi:RNA polymerase sigma-70 factor (ECF subfamily)